MAQRQPERYRTGITEYAAVRRYGPTIHCRGKLLYNDTWNNSKNYIRLDWKQLPSGILHIILSGKDRNVLSERLVFNVNEEADIASLTFTPNQNNYVRRDKVVSQINLTDTEGNPLEGSFAISVTDDSDATPDSTNNILPSMLLTSDLRGYIENPEYYFNTRNCERKADFDVLMMIQGWRRYDIPELLKGNVEKPKIDFEYTRPSREAYWAAHGSIRKKKVSVCGSSLWIPHFRQQP